MSARSDHWNEHARQWSLIGPPLRPVAEDITVLEQALGAWQKQSGVEAPRVLLCGVTPEVARMRWPRGAYLIAVDHSLPMIAGVWPAGEAPGGAVCGDWMKLPLAGASRDVLAGDGCFSLLVGRAAYTAFAEELRRVAAPGALLLMRYFLRPDKAEAVPDVVDDLWHKRIGNFHVFKWRLAMALHGTLEEGVRLADIWNAWHAAAPEPAKLAEHLGWPHATVNTIHNYRGVETRYSFPTLTEARALKGDFEEVAIHVPRYELGERCPTLVMRAR